MRGGEMMGDNPFDGWEMWDAGCHWSRELPDGRKASLSTWQNGSGSRGGYTLTVERVTRYFDDLDTAKAAYGLLAEGRISNVADAPGGREAS